LIEARLPESGEKPFAELTRKGIKAAMKARTPSQASNLLSALRNRLKSSQSARRSGQARQGDGRPRAAGSASDRGDLSTRRHGGQTQEVRRPGRRERAQEELPWGWQSAAEVMAYTDCTESQMMAMFGWPPKLPAHDHRAGEPGEARYDRDGLDRSVR